MRHRYVGLERTIDAHVKNLRRKLGDDARNPAISQQLSASDIGHLMLRSFKGRIVLLVAGVAPVAVALTTWSIAATTQDAIVDRIGEQDAAEAEITERLTFLALEIGDWREATQEVADLAAEFETRIVLTNVDGRLLLET